MSTRFSVITPNAPMSENDIRDIEKSLYDWGIDPSDLPDVMRLIREHVEGLPAGHKDISLVIDSELPRADLLFKTWTVTGTAHNFDGEGYVHLGFTHDGVVFVTVIRPDLHIPPLAEPPSVQ